MPTFTDWKPTRSENDEHPFQLPNDSPATVMQYRVALDFSFPLDFLMAGAISLFVGELSGGVPFIGQTVATQNVSADWKIQLKDGDVVIFEQTVSITLKLTAMAFSVFGVLNMGFFVWEPVSETITTPIVDRNDTTPSNPSWSHTIGGTELSEFGTYERGGGIDATDREGLVIDWWDSAIYEMQVPVGTTLNIEHVAVQGGTTPRGLRFEFRFLEEPQIDAFLDRVGAIRSSLPIRNHIYSAHTYFGPKQRTRRDDIATASRPVSWKDATGRMFWLALHGTAYYLWYSDNEGMEIRPVVYTYEDVSESNPAAVEGAQVTVWSDKYRSVDSKPRKQGGFITTASLNSTLFAAFSPDNRTLGNVRKVGPHDGGRECALMVGSYTDGRARYILTDNVDLQYESSDGLDWVRIED